MKLASLALPLLSIRFCPLHRKHVTTFVSQYDLLVCEIENVNAELEPNVRLFVVE